MPDFILDFKTPAPPEEQGDRLAHLSRHLKARLEEFFALSTTHFDQKAGSLSVKIQDADLENLVKALGEGYNVTLDHQGETLTFYLRQHHRFEEIDRLWGCFFGLLG